MAINGGDKIIEIASASEDDSSGDEYYDCDDDVTYKFKESVLKNKQMFQDQFLGVNELDPNALFELPTIQENEGDQQALMLEMEQQTIPLPNEEIEGNKMIYLSKCLSMQPLEGYDGIFKRLAVKGTGPCPSVDSIVTVHYNAYAEDEASGEIVSFDSTILRGKTKSFMRGQDQVIPGFDIAIGSMKKSEQAEFIFSPEYAFGTKGCPPRIPTDAYVFFRIELINWIDSSDAESYGKLPRNKQKEASFQHMLAAAQSQKRLATSFVEKQNFIQAAKAYKRALNWIEEHGYADEQEEKQGQKICLALNLDLALVYLKLNRPKKTCIYCRDALNIDPNNPKAHYRRGLAQEKLGDNMEARRCLLDAKRILPSDRSINKALFELNAKIEKERFIEKDLYHKMMGALKIEKQTAAASVSDEFKMWTEKEMQTFIGDSSRTQMAFPQAISASERAYLELEIQRLKLKFSVRPSLKGEDIFVVHK